MNLVVYIKHYFRSYRGVPFSSWQGVMLSFGASVLTRIFSFLTLYFVHDLKMDVATASCLISFYGVGAVIGGYLAGALADNVSASKMAAASLLLQAICYALLVDMVSFNGLAATLFCLGVASYGFITSNSLSVLETCSHDAKLKVKVINLLSTAANLGLGVAGLLLGYFLSMGFHALLMWTGGLLFVLASLQCVVTINMKKCSKLEHVGGGKHDVSLQKITPDFDPIAVWLTLGFVFLVGMIVAQLNTTYPLYIHDAYPIIGMNAVTILFTLNTVMVVVFAIPLGDFCDRFNKLLMVGVGGLLIGFSMLLLNLSKAYLLAVLACIIFSFGEMIFFSFAQYICYHARSGSAKGLGLFRTVYASSRMTGPVAGGYLYHHFSGHMVWYVSGLIGVVCFAVCSFYLLQTSDERPGQSACEILA